jgi:DHA2 family multidrug resistance protein
MSATAERAADRPEDKVAAARARGLTWRDAIGFYAMVFGMFMAILDIQIVSSSLNEIRAGLSASPEEISWVQTSYLVAEVVMIPLSGFLARLLSTRVLFALSALSFALSSAACAVVTSLDAMIVARAVQGFVGGAMIPSVYAMSYMLYPDERRARMSVLMGLIATLAPTIGPTLGGYITDWLSWHWLFLVNVVPGVLIAVGVWLFGHFDHAEPELAKGIDIAGLVLMALFLGSLDYVAEEGPRNDWLDDPAIRGLALLALVTGALFFWRMFTYRQPIVDLRAFANRNFAMGATMNAVAGVGLYGVVYVLPLFLGRVRGLDSRQIGDIMFVTGAFQFVSAPFLGMLARKIDLRLMMAAGFATFAVSMLFITPLTKDWGFWELFVPQALRGVSLMAILITANFLAFGTLAPHQLKNAAGLYNLLRNMGGAAGLALINTILIERHDVHFTQLATDVGMRSPVASSMLDGLSLRLADLMPGNSDLAALKLVGQLVEREALVLSFSDCLYVIAAIFAAAVLLIPLIAKPGAPSAPVEEH